MDQGIDANCRHVGALKEYNIVHEIQKKLAILCQWYVWLCL